MDLNLSSLEFENIVTSVYLEVYQRVLQFGKKYVQLGDKLVTPVSHLKVSKVTSSNCIRVHTGFQK